MKYTAIKIDMAASDSRMKRRTADGSMPGAGVEPHQYEAGDMFTDLALGDLIPHDLLCAPCRPYQSCSLGTG